MSDSPFSGIEHTALAARSPEGLADFYVRHMGFRNVTTFDNGATNPKTYMIALGSAMLEIFPCDRAKPVRERMNPDQGMAHIAITVRDFDAAVAELSRSPARIEGEERAGPLNSRAQFYRDPEGNLFHILWRPDGLPGFKQ